jgi:hypothetical protein
MKKHDAVQVSVHCVPVRNAGTRILPFNKPTAVPSVELGSCDLFMTTLFFSLAGGSDTATFFCETLIILYPISVPLVDIGNKLVDLARARDHLIYARTTVATVHKLVLP